MIGNLMSNSMILELVEEDLLRIDPFDKRLLQLANYPLTAARIIFWKEKSDDKETHDLVTAKKDYIFQPHEYAIVTVHERIILPDGIVGRFIPMSGLIEKGFSLTAGKLDPGYGDEGEEIRFGLCNMRDRPNAYDKTSPLAYVEFFDLRGLRLAEVQTTGYDELIKVMRKNQM
ncbi:MAG: hypothetical protein KOO63_12800 [Bacteroidales bacterium]|nr:hypothetical protein [Candidatus Latescibacterota bacterium]